MIFRSFLLCGSMIILAPMPALAGDEVLRGAAPAWVSEAALDLAGAKSAPSELLADWQYRIEDGVVHSYFDRAIRIDNPETLMEENILSLGWLPDKGDLTVHRLEILRDGRAIDLLKDGKFEVIRRELGLEARLIDGELTATLALPGLKIGDILRTTYTTSVADQALGREAQVLQYLGTKPWQVGMGRAVVSWPEDEEMYWAAEEGAGLGEPQLRDGYKYLEVALPLAQRREVPEDAPSRYSRPFVLRVGTFAGWAELSKVMAPHFSAAAEVDEGSDVAMQAQAIMRAVDDPLTRAERAVRLVQDDVSYLLNGLDGGNYLPQRAVDTWEKRYGDCKAKSVLLLALLQQMGIEAEPALVVSKGGDALPELLPVPGDFDHVIVRARIAGQDYWLDGTSTGTRLANIGNVPPFHYALPLRTDGAELVPMTQRETQLANMRMSGTVDHSAGIDFPQLFDLNFEITGPQSASLRSLVDLDNPDMLRQMATSFTQSSSGMEGSVVSSLEVTYDEETATARILVKGVGGPAFEWDNGRVVMPLGENGGEQLFNPDRTRSDWRAIPVATPGPYLMQISQQFVLPEGGRGFSLEGQPELEGGYANTKVSAAASLAGAALRVRTDVRYALGEIAPADVAQAKREARRFAANVMRLEAPSSVTWRWDLGEKQLRQKTAPIVSAYDAAIAFAPEDNFAPLTQKAYFLHSVYDYRAALEAYDQLLEREPTAEIYLQRSDVYQALGRRADAIADLKTAYEVDPSNYTAFALAEEMAYAGEISAAMELLESLPVTEEERSYYASAWATVSGLKGDIEGALELLEDEVADKPEEPAILNFDCWFRGLFNVALDDAVTGCTRAVERADEPASALDSRAMVQFRLGKYDEALTDLNTVLTLSPGLAPSRYLRGVVRLKKGDQAGKEDIATALRMAPQLAEFYTRHGVIPET